MIPNKKKEFPNVSFFIPIRKNSKRIKNKNIKSLPGLKYGLTELKLNQLKKFVFLFKKKFNSNLEIIVSTDCKKILNFTKKFKWLKTHQRKKSLATDDSLQKLINYVPTICKYEFILWSHVTSPLFNEKDYINFLVSFFKIIKRKTYIKSAFSADEIQKFVIDEKGKWISHDFKKKKWPKTQDIKKLFLVNSAAFISKRETYIKGNDRLCKKPLAIKSRIGSGFDVDNQEDFNFLKNEKLF